MVSMLYFSKFHVGCLGFLGTPTGYKTEDGKSELYVGDRIEFFAKGDRHDVSFGTIVEDKGVFKVAECVSFYSLDQIDIVLVLSSYQKLSVKDRVEFNVLEVEDI